MGKPSAVIEDRETKAEKLRANGVNLYPAGYPVDITAQELVQRFGDLDEQALEQNTESHCVAGRIVSRRDFGKASFIHIKDRSGRIQAYVRKNKIQPEQFDTFKLMDIGDFVGIKGPLFRTKTGELTLLAEDLSLLSKSMRPLPEKWHGLTDVETRYRQRYVDLIMNPQVRKVFVATEYALFESLSARLPGGIEKGFFEVETPMMQPIRRRCNGSGPSRHTIIHALEHGFVFAYRSLSLYLKTARYRRAWIASLKLIEIFSNEGPFHPSTIPNSP